MIAAMLPMLTSPDVRLPDLDGRMVQVLPSKAKRGVVVFFVITGCPNANGYVPEMNRIAADYGPSGFDFRLAFSDSFYSPESLRRHYAEFKYRFPAVNDSGHALARLAGATKSPEVAVFSPSGRLLYCGRIDDRYYALGKQRALPKTKDLRYTLSAIRSGKPVANKRTEAIGCFLPSD